MTSECSRGLVKVEEDEAAESNGVVEQLAPGSNALTAVEVSWAKARVARLGRLVGWPGRLAGLGVRAERGRLEVKTSTAKLVLVWAEVVLVFPILTR